MNVKERILGEIGNKGPDCEIEKCVEDLCQDDIDDMFRDINMPVIKLYDLFQLIQPCPFCNGQPEIHIGLNQDSINVSISCDSDQCKVNPYLLDNREFTKETPGPRQDLVESMIYSSVRAWCKRY